MLPRILFMVLLCSALKVYSQGTYHVPFRENSAGVLEIDVRINNYPSRFIFDPGATLVSFGKAFYDSLIEKNCLSRADIKYKTKTRMANGSLADAVVINLKQLRLGGFDLQDIEAMVLFDAYAPSLIGQNVIQQFSAVTIDNLNKRIILERQSVKISALRFIPCNDQAKRELNNIKNGIHGDAAFAVEDITEELKYPPENAVKNLPAKIAIRYFDVNDRNKANALREKVLKLGYPAADVAVQDMTPYYSNAISGYLEIWIK